MKSSRITEVPPLDPNNPGWTSPRSYGVYKVRGVGKSGNRFRYGNHPVRHTELIREYGEVDLLELYLDRDLAREKARLLNLG